jgi:hypothetical protein
MRLLSEEGDSGRRRGWGAIGREVTAFDRARIRARCSCHQHLGNERNIGMAPPCERAKVDRKPVSDAKRQLAFHRSGENPVTSRRPGRLTSARGARSNPRDESPRRGPVPIAVMSIARSTLHASRPSLCAESRHATGLVVNIQHLAPCRMSRRGGFGLECRLSPRLRSFPRPTP